MFHSRVLIASLTAAILRAWAPRETERSSASRPSACAGSSSAWRPLRRRNAARTPGSIRPTRGIRQHGGEQRGLPRIHPRRGQAEVALRGALHAVDAIAPLDGVDVHLEDAPLAPRQLEQVGEVDLERLPDVAPSRPQEDRARALHGDGARAAEPPAVPALVVLARAPEGGPVDAVVGNEAPVLRRHDG